MIDNRGFSEKEIIIQMGQDLKELVRKFDEFQSRYDNDMRQRPTRGEIWGYVGAMGSFAAIVFAITRLGA